MLFNSLQFLLFFPLVTALYFTVDHKYRWFLLLSASCLFYMAFIPVYILILFLTIVIDYAAAIYIERTKGRTRKALLAVSIVSTCLVLFVFKYFTFFNANLAALADFLHLSYPIEAVKIILPIGLSFHTFQSLSYVIEVYRGNQKAERHFGIYALYVMFFPQLVAGPIERPQNLLHQFYEKHRFEYQRVTDGLKLMAWGLFKKVVVADRLAVLVNTVYDRPHDFHGFSLLLATIFFTFQIFCDFSGYSDIAIGSAQVLGFKLMDNFRRPYSSRSVFEFWSRWHISLSTWFRDYLYIPLGGNRVVRWRWYLNLFITFLVSGLWHGAEWGFVVWGALNGFYLLFSLTTATIRKTIVEHSGLNRHPGLHNVIRVTTTFAFIAFAWIFFRAKSLFDALYLVNGIGEHLAALAGALISFDLTAMKAVLDLSPTGVSGSDICIALALLAFMEWVHTVQKDGSIIAVLNRKPVFVRWSVYYGLVVAILILGVFGGSQFIYFQF